MADFITFFTFGFDKCILSVKLLAESKAIFFFGLCFSLLYFLCSRYKVCDSYRFLSHTRLFILQVFK